MARDHASTYAPPLDQYAFARCTCRHLLYAGERPGGRCRWTAEGLCNCVNHRPAKAVAA